jgi:hypothetical protein
VDLDIAGLNWRYLGRAYRRLNTTMTASSTVHEL